MKKKWIFVILILMVFNLASCTESKAKEEDTEVYAPYAYKGKAHMEVDDRIFELEDTPENGIEDIVIKNFMYTITAEFDKKSEILADIEPHIISTENEKELFEDGIYVQSYVIHKIITLTEEQYSQEIDSSEANPLCYYGWKERVDEYKLIEYEIINVDFTQTLSPKANELDPQYGDGTYNRSFIVGKTADDTSYKIYDFGMM